MPLATKAQRVRDDNPYARCHARETGETVGWSQWSGMTKEYQQALR